MNLTKRDLILGTQCEKAIWLQKNHPQLAAQPDQATQLRFKQGNQVDKRARLAYSGGELISETEWDAAVNQTAALVEAGAERLYQPAFHALDLRTRVDILDLLPDRKVIIREVKMSTRLKDDHLMDVATQVLILQQSGFTVTGVYLVLINNEHTPENGISLFHEQDATQDALRLAHQLGTSVSTLAQRAESSSMPDVAIGKHCSKPRTCPFYDHCWKEIPKASVFTIPRLSAEKLGTLLEEGIIHLEQVPSNFNLTGQQREYVEFQTTGQRTTNVQAIKNELASFIYPLYFLDFETHSAPLPPYPQTRPYQQVPFQFSLHILQSDGSLAHKAHLHTKDTDPRPAIAEKLIDFLEESGTILTYNAQFEIKVLNELAHALPALADALHAIVSRVYDQLPLIRKNVQDPSFHRSYSLKTINRELLNDSSYANLPIANGESAHAAWVQLHEITDQAERQRIIKDLEDYCHQDTLAQVNLHYWCERL